MKFSVLMSVYKKENHRFLNLSLQSVFSQSIVPQEVVLVKDGPLTPDLERVISRYIINFPGVLKVLPLAENVGLGMALCIGLEHCANEIVIRMDSDDISHRDRFERQLEFLEGHPEVAVVGTSISEFNNIPGDLKTIRSLPNQEDEILKFAKYRNPLNHPSVAFRKSAVNAVGSYQHMPLFEDYYLWIRLLKCNYRIANMNIPLLNFRVGNDMVGRRHGISYFMHEWRFLNAARKIGFISLKVMVLLSLLKLPLRLLPKRLLILVYRVFLR